MSSLRNRPGDRVQASVISPETYLGGTLEGTIEASSSQPTGRLILVFDTLRFKGNQFTVRTFVLDFVNSLGHKRTDDAGQPAHVEGGAIVARGPNLRLDEGAELTLRAVSP
jgi:hypothetical protein